jgi:hypothetical protein
MYKKIRIILVALACVAMLSVVIGIGAATASKSSFWNNVASGGRVGEAASGDFGGNGALSGYTNGGNAVNCCAPVPPGTPNEGGANGGAGGSLSTQ